MKLCQDCKYFGSLFDECKHPKAIDGCNYITGKKKYTSVNIMRRCGVCGHQGNLFEQKQSFLIRIMNLFKGK